jgi:hypothetical protein
MKKILFTIAMLATMAAAQAGSDEPFIYPNPAHDAMYVQLPESLTGDAQIYVRDLMGRLVLSLERNVDAYDFRKVELMVGNLPNGEYILQVIVNDHVTTNPFVKQ